MDERREARSGASSRRGGKTSRQSWVVALHVLLVLVGTMVSSDCAAAEAEMNISIGGSFGRMVVRPKVKPASDVKSRNLIRQGLDFSCGAASTATIFNYYLGHPISEANVIEGLFRVGNVDKIMERQGFSLLDVKRFAESMGYLATGYRTDIEGLLTVDRPCMVPVVLRGYKHFVILRGVVKGNAFLADPALGNTSIPLTEFEKIWWGSVALVIEPRDGKARNDLKVREDETVFLSSDMVRRTIFQNSLIFGKGSREF